MPDEQTTVVAVKAFGRGDPVVLTEPVTDQTLRAEADLCLVKLVVGPGNPGPEGAPSTSPGIGIEVWLPSPGGWVGRVHALGGNGGLLEDLSFSQNINNVFDEGPPEFRTATTLVLQQNGFINGGTIGPLVQLGIKKRCD